MQTWVVLLWIAVTPTAVAGAAVLLPRAVRAVRRRLAPPPQPLPTGPPLERVAADLRRLLAEHDRVTRSPQLPARGRRLVALEGALSDRALEAARALDLEAPTPPAGGVLPVTTLRALLVGLARSGVVLPDVERFGGARG